VSADREVSVNTMTLSTDVGYPVVYVFRKFLDLEHATRDVRTIKGIEMLTPGDVCLGTRWRETREVMGRRDDAEMELTAFERNRMYRTTQHKAGVRIDTTFSFRPIHGGTRVTVKFDLDAREIPSELVSPVGSAVARDVAQVLDQDLSDLKHVIEHGRTAIV
jgi:hypothetical protein